LHMRLRLTPLGSLNIIPLVIMSQVSSSYNDHLLELFGKVLTKHNITFKLSKNQKSTVITIEGKVNIFDKFLPLLLPYYEFCYWKESSFKLFILVNQIMASGLHSTFQGSFKILELCYYFPNTRTYSFNYWLDIIKTYYNKIGLNNFSGHHLIRPVYARDDKSKIVSWLVYSPIQNKGSLSDDLLFKNKQFGFKDTDSQIKALEAAIEYRDNQITNCINTIEKSVNEKYTK